MHESPVTVAPATLLREFVDDYLYKYQFDLFPVVENGRLLGTAGSREVKGVPREQWERKSVGEVVQPTSPEITVRPETDAVEALSLMSRKNISRLMVVEEGRVVGILTLKDLLRFFSLKADLNEARA
jgi:CBS domain-containing protein